jgi:hypothetical protein
MNNGGIFNTKQVGDVPAHRKLGASTLNPNNLE